MELTLATTKVIINKINGYSGKSMDFDAIVKHCDASRADVAIVIEFLQELQISSPSAGTTSLMDRVDMSVPVDLEAELSFNYKVGRSILEDLLEQDAPDKEELRKTLTTIQKFMDSMLKMQEKVFNVQQIQRFQEAVMEVLSAYELKDTVVRKLLELPL